MLKTVRTVILLFGFLMFLTSCGQFDGATTSNASTATSTEDGAKLLASADARLQNFDPNQHQIPGGSSVTSDEVKQIMIDSLQQLIDKLSAVDTSQWTDDMKVHLAEVIQRLKDRLDVLKNAQVPAPPPRPSPMPNSTDIKQRICDRIALSLKRTDLSQSQLDWLQKVYDDNCK
jgi:hypothetical protein